MVRTAANVIAGMHVGQAGIREPKKEIVAALMRAGYGEEKAKKWVENFITTGDVYIVGSDAITGLELYTTKWWTSYAMPPRRRISRPRIDAELLTDEERALLDEVA